MKYTVWVDYGCEGWKPTEYDNLQLAIMHDSYGSPKRITIDVKWKAQVLESES